MLLPAVAPVKPMESVSTTWGLMLSTGTPRTSAACMATATLEPPMSAEPSLRVILPSGFTWRVHAAAAVPFIQNPTAIPRPLLSPSIGAE